MKSISTYIIAIVLISNLAHGSESVQIYEELSYPTPQEWTVITSLDDNTAEEEEIALERAMRDFCKVGTWKFTNKHITLKNDAWHSGSQTPTEFCEYFYSKSELKEQSECLMNKAQHCLESLMFRIGENFKKQKLFIHRPGNELYLDRITKNELRDRIMLHENICGAKRWIGFSDSEDEAPKRKRQHK